MYSVISNTRNSKLFLIVALTIVAITLLILAVIPAVSAPQLALAPAPSLSDAGSDYYQRHPDAVIPAVSAPELVFVPTSILPEAGSDYYHRHPGLRISTALGESLQMQAQACESPVDCR